MSDELMELNDTELNYIYILKRTQMTLVTSRMKALYYKKPILFKFSIVQTSEGFSIRGILHLKTHCVFQNKEDFFD